MFSEEHLWNSIDRQGMFNDLWYFFYFEFIWIIWYL